MSLYQSKTTIPGEDLLKYQLGQLSISNEILTQENVLLVPIVSLFTVFPAEFASLVKNPDDLQKLLAACPILTWELISKASVNIAAIFENLQQFLKMDLITKTNLVNNASKQIAGLCKSLQQFALLDEQTADALILREPAQIIALIKTPDEFLTLIPQYWQLNPLLSAHSDKIVTLFTTADQLVQLVRNEKHLLTSLALFDKQSEKIAQVFNRPEQISALYQANFALAMGFTKAAHARIAGLFSTAESVIGVANQCPLLVIYLFSQHREKFSALFETAAQFSALCIANKEVGEALFNVAPAAIGALYKTKEECDFLRKVNPTLAGRIPNRQMRSTTTSASAYSSASTTTKAQTPRNDLYTYSGYGHGFHSAPPMARTTPPHVTPTAQPQASSEINFAFYLKCFAAAALITGGVFIVAAIVFDVLPLLAVGVVLGVVGYCLLPNKSKDEAAKDGVGPHSFAF